MNNNKVQFRLPREILKRLKGRAKKNLQNYNLEAKEIVIKMMRK